MSSSRRLLCCACTCLASTSIQGQASLFELPRRAVPIVEDGTYEVASRDLDGDGDVDVFAATRDSGRDLLYLNRGDGSFTDASSQLPVTATDLRSYSCALSDLDSDGDFDVFVGRLGLPTLLENDGAANFSEVVGGFPFSPFFASWTQDLALFDADGDGDDDAYLANRVDRPDFLFRNEGGFVFSGGTAGLPSVAGVGLAGGRNSWGVDAGDCDLDGDLDLLIGVGYAVAGASLAANDLYLNDGVGQFTWAASALPTSSAETRAVAFVDVDSDGDLDAYVGNALAKNQLLENDGTGNFLDRSSMLPDERDFTLSVEVADVDGDGAPDVLVANGWYEADRLFFGDGAGGLSDGSARLPREETHTFDLAADDFDADGDLDVFVGLHDGESRIWKNDGTGTFYDLTADQRLPPSSGETVAAEFGDLDADGDLDLVVGEHEGHDHVYANDGSGFFTDLRHALKREVTEVTGLALGDVNGDGTLDALFVRDGQNRVFRNLGSGHFELRTADWPILQDPSVAIVLGDVDADGDLDAVVASDEQHPDQLFVNDGTGRFLGPSAQLPSHAFDTEDVALFDADADGDLDLYAASRSLDRLYLNDGAGAFLHVPQQTPALTDFTEWVGVGDFDGDGDVDLLNGNQITSRYLLNDGAGNFVAGSPGASADYGLGVGDFNGDGRDDVWCSSYQGSRLFLGQGSWLVDASGLLPEESFLPDALMMTLGDVDGDGDLDVFHGCSGSDRLYVNRTRHLEGRRTASAAQALRFGLAGTPSGPWVLARASGVLDPVFVSPQFGSLFLDPSASLVLCAAGGLDSTGEGAHVIDVPPGTPLGQTVHWQALVGSPAHLTNHVRQLLLGL